ncbi:uncharacterized protein LOC109839074, partial [Asparagus officinalis]|uniref:uncharacterized protein LOC109839074 n=1 Tax=Asparagus officinalis TaxID=4686 RepID=UPI00098DE662
RAASSLCCGKCDKFWISRHIIIRSREHCSHRRFAAGLALISVAAASSILLQVGKNAPQVQSTEYSGPPLSYYIGKFKPASIVEAAFISEHQSSPTVEASAPSKPEIASNVQAEGDASAAPEVQVELKVEGESSSVENVP